MYDIYSRPGRSYFSGILILLGAVLVGMFAGSALSMLLWTVTTGQSIFALQKEMANPSYKEVLRWIQVISTFFVFLVPSVVMAFYMSRRPMRFLGFNRFVSPRQYFITLLIMLAALPLSGALGDLNEMIPLTPALETKFKFLEDQYMQQVKVISSIKCMTDYIASLILIALLPAFFEEMLFRGGLQNLLFRQTKNVWIAVLATSIIFSAFHMSFYGFLPRMMLGVVLGLIYQWTGNLWLPTLGHFLNNAIGVTQLYWYQMQGKSLEEAMKDDPMPMWAGSIGLIVVVALFFQLHKQALSDKKTLVPPEDQANEEQWLS